ncbi:MAG TPA: extracellular solute-binding protein [Solirubrobacteraceae bacterium]|nr:extracellular solute-binding protein [Solirubrobacteraceae bacterium]
MFENWTIPIRSDRLGPFVLLRRGRGWSAMLLGLGALAVLIGGCGSSKGSATTTVPASAQQTIVFAESGLGTEGEQTKKAIVQFEKVHPNIKVSIDVLSPNSTTYLQQLQQRFIAGSPTPDILESDVTYPAKFAKAGWIKSLSAFNPPLTSFFANAVAAGQYEGKPYAIPWFSNPEGLFYRTDLIPRPPTNPEQVVADAKEAMSKDSSLKEGFAFEGHKYEGAITSFLTVAPAFGGRLTTTSIDSHGNVKALEWLHEAIYTHKIAPQAVTGWEEGQVQEEFTSGRTPFAINYPFVAAVAEEGGPAKGHVGYIPFPPAAGGKPGAALGGEMLAINAASTHSAAAYELIKYLTTPAVQSERAVATGDPPSLPSAYTSALYAKAPIFKQVKVLNGFAQPRPVSPEYLKISEILQDALTSVYANSTSPSSALSSAASQIEALGG